MNSAEIKDILSVVSRELEEVRSVTRRFDEGYRLMYEDKGSDAYKKIISKIDKAKKMLWYIRISDLSKLDDLESAATNIIEPPSFVNPNPPRSSTQEELAVLYHDSFDLRDKFPLTKRTIKDDRVRKLSIVILPGNWELWFLDNTRVFSDHEMTWMELLDLLPTFGRFTWSYVDMESILSEDRYNAFSLSSDKMPKDFQEFFAMLLDEESIKVVHDLDKRRSRP